MPEPERILLVEDDRHLRETILGALRHAGYDAEGVADGIQAGQRLRVSPFHVVLLDIGLPFVDGWQILEQLEGRPLPAVIVVSARGDEGDKIRALDLGADDYLTKPFGADELLARIRAVMRRLRIASHSDQLVSSGDVTVDLQSRVVMRSGREVRLSPTEWALLTALAVRPGVVRDQRSLLAEVWGAEYIGDRNYLRVFVQRLRRKLEADPADPSVIVTVGRQGYRFGAAQPLPGALTIR